MIAKGDDPVEMWVEQRAVMHVIGADQHMTHLVGDHIGERRRVCYEGVVRVDQDRPTIGSCPTQLRHCVGPFPTEGDGDVPAGVDEHERKFP